MESVTTELLRQAVARNAAQAGPCLYRCLLTTEEAERWRAFCRTFDLPMEDVLRGVVGLLWDDPENWLQPCFVDDFRWPGEPGIEEFRTTFGRPVSDLHIPRAVCQAYAQSLEQAVLKVPAIAERRYGVAGV